MKGMTQFSIITNDRCHLEVKYEYKTELNTTVDCFHLYVDSK